MNLSVDDAKTVLTFISATIIPFAVIWLQQVTWSSQAKFALAAFLSLVAGGLAAYVGGQIVFSGSLVQNAFVILGSSQLIYFGAFRALGLEKILFPKEALVNEAKDQVAVETDKVSKEVARDILDPNSPPALDVSANVVQKDGSVS